MLAVIIRNKSHERLKPDFPVFLLQSVSVIRSNTLPGVKQVKHRYPGSSTQLSLLSDLFHYEHDEQDMTLTLPSLLDCM